MLTRTARSRTTTALLRSCSAVLACCGLLAMPAGQAQERGEFRLQVRPSICVSYDNETPCRMSMQVSWEATVVSGVCLLQTEQQEPLACWDNASSGATEVQYADTRDVQYVLVTAISRDVLAEADVMVINRDLRSSRKRRRHVWSIL